MGRLYSTYILADKDVVAIEQLAFGQNQRMVEDVSKANAFQMKQILKKFARHIKDNRIPNSELWSNKYNGEQFYIKVIGAEQWIPVDHFLWKDDNKECRLDFTCGRDYVSYQEHGHENFYKRHQSLKRLANMIWK